jgi:hypothetical protein
MLTNLMKFYDTHAIIFDLALAYDAIDPPQIIIRVGAAVEVVGVGAVEAHINE